MYLDELKIATERLILKAIRLSDAQALFGYRSNPNVYKYQSWQPQKLEDVIDFINTKIASEPDIAGKMSSRMMI
jgi:RimJ/RimL family protein N-acetyltransferase